MQDNSALLIAVAGFAVVCAGTLFLMLLLVLRVTGRSLWSFMGLLLRNSQQEDSENEPAYIPRPHQDLRQMAQAADFDDALAREMAKQSSSDDPNVHHASTDLGNLPPASMERLKRVNQMRKDDPRPRQQNEGDEYMLGGLFDDDGSPDF
ncbi:MAG: hypothetical protein IT320_15405 [Anaerolineae bacterium]|nr:hypothetical protein [Anaerolineae bacterium]